MKCFQDFKMFIREQGVLGMAIGIIIGSAIGKTASALVDDLVNPFVALVFGASGSLANAKLQIGSVIFLWGHFLGVLIDLAIVAVVVYIALRLLGLHDITKKK